MERVQGVIKIKNKEQRADMATALDEYVRQYKWFSNTEKPFETILEILDSYSEKLKSDDISEMEKAQILGEAHSLKGVFETIRSEEYKPFLLRNIMSILLSVEDYDASLEQRTPLNIIVGVIRGDKDIKDYLKRKYAFYMTRVTGSLSAPRDPRLEKIDDVIGYISRNYELYGLVKEEIENLDKGKVSPQKELNPLLLPVVSSEKVNRLDKLRVEMLTKFLNEKGMNYDGTEIKQENEKIPTEKSSGEKESNKKGKNERSKGEKTQNKKGINEKDENLKDNNKKGTDGKDNSEKSRREKE